MGNSWTKSSKKILMMGLDAAGKTTILYKMKGNEEVVTTIPTIGFIVEELTIGGSDFTAWDVGGRSNMRPLWRHYYQNTEGIVFVVDANDKDRIIDVKDELTRILAEDGLLGLPVLVFANKSDLDNAYSASQLATLLPVGEDRKLNVVSCCATNGDGLWEGMLWLSNTIQYIDQGESEANFLKCFSMNMNPFSKLLAKMISPPTSLLETAADNSLTKVAVPA